MCLQQIEFKQYIGAKNYHNRHKMNHPSKASHQNKQTKIMCKIIGKDKPKVELVGGQNLQKSN